MPSIFDGYCYATTNEAADAELSKPVVFVDSGILASSSVSGISGSSAVLTFNYQAFAGGAPVAVSISRNYPACSSVGYQHNFSGLTLADVNELAWLIVAVWASAWAIKTMRGRG